MGIQGPKHTKLSQRNYLTLQTNQYPQTSVVLDLCVSREGPCCRTAELGDPNILSNITCDCQNLSAQYEIRHK